MTLNQQGHVSAWGDNQYGQCNIPWNLNATDIAAGNHSLALRVDGTVVAWGDNAYGQTNVPPGLSEVQAIAAGLSHSVALRSDGRVVAWGRNTQGQTDVPEPLGNVVRIGASERNSLAVSSDGALVVWGDNSSGQCSVPQGVADVKMAAAGFAHVVALKRDGAVIAWGDNSFGQTNVPPGLANVVAVSAAGNISLALTANGSLVLWGQNAWEQNREVEWLTDITDVSLGKDFGVAAFQRKPEPPPTLDPFDPGITGGYIHAISMQPDGKILVGGNFTSVAGEDRRNIVRLNPDGSLDRSFSPQAGANEGGDIKSVVVQPSGHILIGGRFRSSGAEARTDFARLNPVGTVDPAFNGAATGDAASWAPEGSDWGVDCIAVDTSARVLVGGGFARFAGQPRPCLARLNPDGTLDETFNPGADYVIRAIAIQRDDKILVSGKFTVLAGRKCTNVGRLNPDGTFDETFNPGYIDGGAVETINIQGDGKIVLGGGFKRIGGLPRMGIARLRPDGSLDFAFNEFGSWVGSVVEQADGRFLVLSSLLSSNVYLPAILRLERDGTLDPGFALVYNLAYATDAVQCLALQSDGKILVGGRFTSFGGQIRRGMARLFTTAPARQKLSFNSSNIVWQQGGMTPEFWHASFAYSTNGANWVGPVPAERVVGGWKKSGLSLPVQAQIRAQGYVAADRGGGSGWVVESTIKGAPQFSNLAFGPGGLKLSYAGLPGMTYTVEFTHDLRTDTWTVLDQRDGSGLDEAVTDPTAAGAMRFYRVKAGWKE